MNREDSALLVVDAQVKLLELIPQRARIGFPINVNMPAKYRVQRAIQHGVVDGSIGPEPKFFVCLAMRAQ